MAGKDRTAAPHESVRHDEPHSHPGPVPHLKPEWDNHGPTFAHPHQHVRGGGNADDHHEVDDDGHVSATDLKRDREHADDSNS